MKRWISLFALISLALLAPRAVVAQTCGPMDVVFVIDDTGSMDDAIANIRSQLASIINDINTASGGDYRLGLVTFKDTVTVVDDLAAGNGATVSAHVSALTAGGGGGEPEASDEALNTVIHGLNASDRAPGQQTGDFGAFRATALKIIVLVTDARPGGFTNTFSAANAHLRATEAAALGIKISAVYVPTSGVITQISDVMKDYATTTQGRFLTTQSNGDGTAAAIRDVIASCGGNCTKIAPVSLVCATDRLGGFLLTFTVTNLTNVSIQHLFVLDLPAGVTAKPNTLNFSDEPGGFLAPGKISKPKMIRLQGAGAVPGGTIKLRFSFHDAELIECCAVEQTIVLPDCKCAQVLSGAVKCGFTFSGSPTFTYDFTLENLSVAPPVEVVLVAPKPPATFTVGQSTQTISPPLGYGGDVIRHITLSGPGIAFGGKACLRISTHDKSLNECCAIDKCIDLPSNPFSCLDLDPGPVTPLGGATLFPSDLGLDVEGIGTSGEDGVRFDFGRTEDLRVGWRPFEPTPPDGALMRFGATGSVDGTPGRPLGELKITDIGSALEISADYSDVGSTSQRLELYRDGVLVQTITGHSGSTVARVPAWPTSCGKGLVDLDGHSTACYWPMWDEDIPIQIWNGPLVMANGLRVLAENPTGDLDFLQTFSVRAANIPSITVTSAETATPAPGDLNLILNTGFDQDAGTTLPLGTLPEGTRDFDWGVLGSTVPIPAKLVINRRAAWPAPLADSQWISVNPNQGRSSASRRRVSYENCFCVGEGATRADLSLRLWADDEATVFLNGTQIGGPGGSFFSTPLAVDFTGAVGSGGPFRFGENCLVVDVDDRGGIVTGFDLTGSVKAVGGACEDE